MWREKAKSSNKKKKKKNELKKHIKSLDLKAKRKSFLRQK